MAKTKTYYVCQNCGSRQLRWQGQCPNCNEWNTLVEETETPRTTAKRQADVQPVLKLSEIPSSEGSRLRSNIGEVDRVLGGGIVRGSVILLGGEPGIGKSTILLQLIAALPQVKTLYVTGEESLSQVKLRAERLAIADNQLRFLNNTDVDQIVSTLADYQPELAIIDSIQTLQTQDLGGASGSVGQIRESTARLIEIAKRTGIATVIVGHVTKEGEIAGPKVLEHMVDVVLYMEGDPLHQYRILRSSKNRFGNINEIGLFQMNSAGLAEVMTPETLFITGETQLSSGAIRTITMEGSRPLVVELQSLTVPSGFGYPKRTSSGFPLNRLQLLIAVLIRRAGLKLFEHDVYASIVGGLSLSEAAMDFPFCLAITSSLLDKRCPQDMIAIGEVGLSGAILPAPQIEARLSEAKRLGFTSALVSDKGYDKIKGRQNGLDIVPVRHLEQALQHLNWK